LHLASIERVMLHEIRSGAPLRRSEAHAAALGLHSLLEGLIQNWMLDPAAFDLVKVGTRVVDTYLVGLGLMDGSARPACDRDGLKAAASPGPKPDHAAAKQVRAVVAGAGGRPARTAPSMPRRVPA
jgi:hypothetical protein